VIVAALIALENVALTELPTPTPVAPSTGRTSITDGGGGDAAVVNVHVTGLASGVASSAATVVVSRAVYVVPYERSAVGVNVAVRDAAS
jgi:hypothetical protein